MNAAVDPMALVAQTFSHSETRTVHGDVADVAALFGRPAGGTGKTARMFLPDRWRLHFERQPGRAWRWAATVSGPVLRRDATPGRVRYQTGWESNRYTDLFVLPPWLQRLIALYLPAPDQGNIGRPSCPEHMHLHTARDGRCTWCLADTNSEALA